MLSFSGQAAALGGDEATRLLIVDGTSQHVAHVAEVKTCIFIEKMNRLKLLSM